MFYVFQLGFLDGKAGYIYARLLSQYEYQISAKLYELRYCDGQLNREEKFNRGESVKGNLKPKSAFEFNLEKTEVELPQSPIPNSTSQINSPNS